MVNQEILPETADLSIYRGGDTPLEVDVLTAQDEPFDLSGCAFELQARVRASQEVVMQLQSSVGQITATANTVLVLFPRAMTEGASWTRAEYDLQMTDREGYVKTLLKGQITLVHDVTRGTEYAQTS